VTEPSSEGTVRRAGGFMLALAVLALCVLGSLVLGAASIPLGEVLGALLSFDGSTEHLIVRTQRVPRTLIAMSVGASLAVAGAIIQGFTRNPLAEPGILGINAGAALAVVGSVALFGNVSSALFAVAAFVGATLAGCAIVGLASMGRGGLPATTLVLAGTAMMALLTSLTTAILIHQQGTLADVRFWLAGSLAGRDISVLAGVAPYMLLGLGAGFLLSPSLTTLSLGEDVARAVGQRIAWVKGGGLAAVILLAGTSVSVAGPIAFVGLIVPNGVRLLVGPDYRLIIPISALLGAALVLAADVVSRLVLRPAEIPVGVTIALIGGPTLIYILQRGGRWGS